MAPPNSQCVNAIQMYGASNLRDLADDNNYNHPNPVRITIEGGYFISTSTGTPALTTGSFSSELKVTNYAYIMGKGGAGGNALVVMVQVEELHLILSVM